MLPQFSEVPGLPTNYILPGPLYTPESALGKPCNGAGCDASSYASARPATSFQRMTNTVLAQYGDIFLKAYFDDVITYPNTVEDH
jgi:hypothetical protein